MTRTLVTITIDTEASIAGTFADPEYARPVFEGPVDGVVNGRSEALGFLMQCFVRNEISATFFVETLHTRYFGFEPMAERCARLAEAGQDVQLHIHPCWRSFADGELQEINTNDESHGRPLAELQSLFREAQDRFVELTGHPAVAARTGKFSTNTETFTAMAPVGIRVTSNICTGFFPPPNPDLRLVGGRVTVAGIKEIPVTCFAARTPKGRTALRPLQICACSLEELTHVTDTAQRQGVRHLMVVTHPFEFIKKRDESYNELTRNRLVQRRLERYCAFLKDHDDRFEVVSMAECGERLDDLSDAPEPNLSVPAYWTAKRVIENGLTDRIWAL